MASETEDKNPDSTGTPPEDVTSQSQDDSGGNAAKEDPKQAIPQHEEVKVEVNNDSAMDSKTIESKEGTSVPEQSPTSTEVIDENSRNSNKSGPSSILSQIRSRSIELDRLHELCTSLVGVQSSQSPPDDTKTTDSILQLLVTDDLSSIRDPEVLRSFFIDYLNHLPPKVITELLSVLIAIVKKSVFHLESARGLLSSCLSYLLSESSNTTKQSSQDSSIGLTRHFLREWVNLLVAHSCDVEELKLILKLSEQDPTLLNFTQQANLKQRNRPHAFFAFPGTKGSMMSLPPFQKWPIQLGWSFSTWFFLEPKACAQPYLYNFKTGKSGLGFSAHFTGNCLVLTSIRVKGKGVQHCVAYEFPSYKWIHCAITYHNKWRASEIKVYVNGQLTANIEMPWQVQTTEMFDKCFIGGSGSITGNDRTGGGDLNCFCGQMSAIYLFNEGLSPTQTCALHRLGPSYMGQFRYINESHVNLPPQIPKTLYEEKFASSLFCLFTPVAVDSGTLCIQLASFRSPASGQNYFLSAPHAALQGKTRAIITQPICSTLQSIGCSRSLLPLLDVFASKGNPDACASLIGFLCDLLESSPHWFANEIVQNNGFVVVACALASNARLLINEKLLDIFLNLTRTLLTTSSTASDSLLLKHLMDNILFNPSLWVYADTKLQIKLYNYLATEFLHGTRHGSNKYTISNSSSTPYLAYNPTGGSGSLYSQPNSSNASGEDQSKANGGLYESSPVVADILFGEIRRVSTVLQSLHALKYYYWLVEEPNINHKARNYPLRPNQENLYIIRAHILSFTKELILRANSTPLDEVQGLLNYLSACTQPENLTDAMDTLASLIAEHPRTMVAALDQKQAIRVIFTLIGSKSEQIRIKALSLLTLFLSQCLNKKKQDIMGSGNLYMLLCDRLRPFRLTLELYEALIDLLIEENNPNRKLDSQRPQELSKKRIENSMIVKVLANLICEQRDRKYRSKSTVNNNEDEIDGDSDDDDHDDDVDDDDDEYDQGDRSMRTNHVDIRSIFINDLWNLIVNSRENRRIILQMSVWQHWLINLIHSTVQDSQLVRDQILAIFRVLLYHAIRYEYGGWRVWIDTLAIIHAKVSFDEFRQQLSKADSSVESSHSQANQKKSVPVVAPKDKTPNGMKSINEGDQETGEIPEGEAEGGAKSQTIVSSISEHVPNESRGINISSGQGYDEPDQRGESKVEEAAPDSKENSNSNKTTPPEEPVDSPDLAPSRAFRKVSLSEDASASNQPETTATSNEAQATSDNQITRQQSLTSIQLEEPAEAAAQVEEEPHDKQEAPRRDHNHDHLANNNSSEPHSLQSNKATACPAFRIPEFRWTNVLIKLLNDLMFSIECDLYHWRYLAKMTSIDTPPFQTKVATSAGGGGGGGAGSGGGQASGSSSSKGAASLGSSSVQLDSILQKADNQIYIINVVHLVSQLADNVIIAAGGLLPLLADATGGTKASSSSSRSSSDLIKSTATCEGLSLAQANSLLYRLVNMIDMVIFAACHINLGELEADKNTTSGGILRQCLRLSCTVTVKNCLILRNLNNKISSMDLGAINLASYELPSDMFDSYQGCSLLSANGLFENSALTLDNTDLIADLEYSPHQTPQTSSMPSVLPFQTSPIRDPNKLLQAIDIGRIQTCIYYDNNTESRQSQFLALSSLYFISVLMVSKYRDIIEPKHKSQGSGRGSKSGGSNTYSSPAASQKADPSSTSGEQQAAGGPPVSSIEANLLNFGKMQPNSPAPTASALTNMLTTRLENTLDTVCPLLKSIMCDFCSFLSKTLIGSHGQDLVNKEAERTFRRANASPVELVMLLCSQEWQNTLQKNAGLAFIELINEGRVLSHGMKDHIVRVAMEAEFILSRLRADDVAKHEQFGLACSETLAARLHEEVLINSLISSAARRDFMAYNKFKEMVQKERRKNYKLDIWEDDDRRKRRFVFDSWDDSSQRFYSSQAGAQNVTSSRQNHENSSEDQVDKPTDDTSRILELQKTIEMGGINDHCSPTGTKTAPSSANQEPPVSVSDVINQQQQQDVNEDDEGDEDVDEEDDDDENRDESEDDIYEDEMDTNETRRTKRNHEANSKGHNTDQESKIHEAYQSAKIPTKEPMHASEMAANDTKNNQQQAWDYEDCGSVNDFTGSVIFAAECSLIWSIYAIPGVLQITTHELYFESNQNIGDAIDALKKENPKLDGQRDDDSQPLRSLRGNHGESNSTNSTSEHISLRKIDLKALRYCDFLTGNAKFSLNDIRAIFSRHYLLQPNALEIFLAQRTSVMFAFGDFDLVKRVVKYLPPVGVGIKYGIQQSRRASLMSPRQLFAASNMTQKWQKREIGNFQYLMFLNTIAGRTYQDLNQYPVFPWILTNYESEELDLNLPTNFRDLSKPVGALNSKRRAEFVERYETWDNPKVPAFHYGTHYSTAAFTLNWLCRLRGAHNSSYLALQDGKYEEDSRLFLSIGDSWVSSLIGGQQNVKELIPEFFYLPEMFHSNLGLPEVEYPAWAKSADQFVRIHRIALESELVSCQLHQWIDLIFGYKQRGPEAINSVNTFYYLTYQGNVNLNMIQDGSLRDAIETQIKHFGQTPSQLTTEPHPPRFSALHASPLMFSPSPDEVNKVIKFPFNNPVVHISSCINNYIAPNAASSSNDSSYSTGTVHNPNNEGPSSVLTITSNHQYQIHKWMPAGSQSGGHPFVIDPQLEGNSYASSSNRRQLIHVDDLCPSIRVKLSNQTGGDALSHQNLLDEVPLTCTHYIVTLNGKYIIMGSFYDNSFRVFTTETGRLCQVIYGHRAPITCLARSEGNSSADFYLATGSQDCSLLVWTWNERYAQVEGSGVSAVHNPLPKLSICGHQTPVLSATICAELGLIISGSKNLILVHTTSSGENLLQIDVNLPDIMDRTLNESRLLHSAESSSMLQHQRPQVQDKQRTILEASMLGEDTRTTTKVLSEKSGTSSRSQSPNSMMKDEKISQLRGLCCSDYYITNLQLARELGFIVCVALPPPRRKSKTAGGQNEVYGVKSSPALLLTFNLKGSLMDSTPIGHSVSSPRLGDVCILQTSRDGEHLILNDSPITIKIYRTFGLQPLYAFNTNDIPNALSEDQNRIRSLVLLDQRYILVGLDNGKVIVYNCDFKSFT